MDNWVRHLTREQTVPFVIGLLLMFLGMVTVGVGVHFGHDPQSWDFGTWVAVIGAILAWATFTISVTILSATHYAHTALTQRVDQRIAAVPADIQAALTTFLGEKQRELELKVAVYKIDADAAVKSVREQAEKAVTAAQTEVRDTVERETARTRVAQDMANLARGAGAKDEDISKVEHSFFSHHKAVVTARKDLER